MISYTFLFLIECQQYAFGRKQTCLNNRHDIILILIIQTVWFSSNSSICLLGRCFALLPDSAGQRGLRVPTTPLQCTPRERNTPLFARLCRCLVRGAAMHCRRPVGEGVTSVTSGKFAISQD